MSSPPPSRTFTIPGPVKYLIGFCLAVGLALNALGLLNDWTITQGKALLTFSTQASLDVEIAGIFLIAIAVIFIALDIILPESQGETPS
jgi:hypothetical protein